MIPDTYLKSSSRLNPATEFETILENHLDSRALLHCGLEHWSSGAEIAYYSSIDFSLHLKFPQNVLCNYVRPLDAEVRSTYFLLQFGLLNFAYVADFPEVVCSLENNSVHG